MNKPIFTDLVIICVIAHLVRTIYEILKHRNIIKATRLTFVIVFADMLVLWTSWFLLCSADIRKVDLPPVIRYSGVVLVCAGLVSFLMGLLTIKTLESFEGDLITKGIYSRIRHPMYLGFILWLIGSPVFFGGVFSFLLCFLFLGNILYWRYLEEKELLERFPEYRAYRETTIF
jgi:protein-S-isoprenylcysteine O-methyltransferase Ste14